uniref:Ring finger protein 41, like n=1 Tax=Tetraodon nigroviridis TaxID=99883 RepID=H3DLZ0_TETNG
MGYDLERFVGYVNEGLLCCVCRDVLERPLQGPCEHAFCSSCISSWLVYHRSCPEDRLPLEVGSLKPLYRYMRNDLTRLQIRCVNAARGCEVVCSLENLNAHEDECEFAFVSCSNTGCGHMLPSLDRSQHNCVAELRVEVEMLRIKRRHMVQKESQLKNEVEELKGQLSCLMSDMRALLGAERLRRQELAEAEVEKRELLELLKEMQPSR